MSISLEQLQAWMDSDEDEHLEFKEAGRRYDFEKLVKYCAALANEGGGRIILGVSDSRPRRIVGTEAFRSLERTKAGLIERLHLRIAVERIDHPDGRVLVFEAPGHPIGMPVGYRGAYWMRGGEDLVPMTPDMLKRIFAEAGQDFSAAPCPGAALADLDTDAVDVFRMEWHRKSNNDALLNCSQKQLLGDAELIIAGQPTHAALILFGKPSSLGRRLAQAEMVWEYRSSEHGIHYSQRREFREGFFRFHNELWKLVNERNDIQQYQNGLFRYDIPTFHEEVVREAILNAVSHRDYRLPGSIFMRQSPRNLEVISPGGFPPGITAENIIQRQSPRNRRIAETFARCGLVERSGQGADLMFDRSIREGKPAPDFSGTDDYQVSLTLGGEVSDPRFLRFLEKVGKERLQSFSTLDLLVLDLLHRDQPVADYLNPSVKRLADLGVVETIGRGHGARTILSRSLYRFIGKGGAYTRKKGLDRETRKELLLKHIGESGRDGSPIRELLQVLPDLSRGQVKELVGELASEEKIHLRGRSRGARWYAGAGPD